MYDRRGRLVPTTQQRPYKMDSWDREAHQNIYDKFPSRPVNRKGWESSADLLPKAVSGKQLQKLVSGEMMIESKLGA